MPGGYLNRLHAWVTAPCTRTEAILDDAIIQWINGFAGASGKTTIAYTMADYCKQHIAALSQRSHKTALKDSTTPLVLHEIPLEQVERDLKLYADHEFKEQVAFFSIEDDSASGTILFALYSQNVTASYGNVAPELAKSLDKCSVPLSTPKSHFLCLLFPNTSPYRVRIVVLSVTTAWPVTNDSKDFDSPTKTRYAGQARTQVLL